MNILQNIKTKCKSKNVLVSACIAGKPYSYKATQARHQLVNSLINYLGLVPIPVCPERAGGLPTPRDISEIVKGDGFDVIKGTADVKTKSGQNTTRQYVRGAEEALKICLNSKAELMISQRRSPSCSCSNIYDGNFNRRIRKGFGVTTALLKTNGIEVIELEKLIQLIFEDSIFTIISSLHSGKNWNECLHEGKEIFGLWLSQESFQMWKDVLIKQFEMVLPKLHQNRTNAKRTDSDTFRFFMEFFNKVYGSGLDNPKKKCKICTYPEGFLDSYIMDTGICSVCVEYNANKAILENRRQLNCILNNKLKEIKGEYEYDGIIAYSGGKDSVYMLYQLCKKYELKVLCVMDLLNQQNELAIENAENSAQIAVADLLYLDNIPCASNIRKNFILTGNHFCRLCLRSHFIRIYNVALKRKIPLIFFGLSPFQCLDCVDAINWVMQSINDVKTPFNKLNNSEILEKYKHRAFQGGFEVGFKTENEKKLLKEWLAVFDNTHEHFSPLIIPFYIYDGYPSEDIIMNTISAELGWKKPEVIFNHTNCRMLPFANIYHKAIGRHHLNYKEKATKLRFIGDIIEDDKIENVFCDLEQIKDQEKISKNEFIKFLKDEFEMSLNELPILVKKNLYGLLKKED